jgi:uncharacterized repeat protein (TIGR01451 family)
MRKDLLLSAIAICIIASCCKAQYVNIPDSNFRNFLQSSYPGCMNTAGQLDTTCSVLLTVDSLAFGGERGIYCNYYQDMEGIQYFKNLIKFTLHNTCLMHCPLPPSVEYISAQWSSGFSLPPYLKYLDISYGALPANFTLPSTLETFIAHNAGLTSLPALPASLTVLDVSNPDFSGSPNNLTQLPALPAGLRYLNCQNNFITLLPELPPALTYLNCLVSRSSLSSLPALPPLLDTLELWGQSITQMPALPSTLTYFSCAGSDLTTSFPALPPALKIFRYYYAQNLTALPALPNSITEIYCESLGVTSITALPSSLKSFTFRYDTMLTALPALPASLEYIDCSGDRLTTLPSLPQNLLHLSCNGNKLTSLPAIPPRVKAINCADNELLQLPAMPDSLIYLIANKNKLTGTPSLSNTMIAGLYISYNELVSITNLPTTLNSLYCYNNRLASLPALPASLDTMDCKFNELTSLPLLLHTTIVGLECSHNRLSALPDLPATLLYVNCGFNNSLYCLPKLPVGSCVLQFAIDTTRIKCVPNRPESVALAPQEQYEHLSLLAGYLWCNTPGTYPSLDIPICSPLNNATNCQSYPVVSGKVFFDANNNGIKESTEQYKPLAKAQLSDVNYTFTNSEGYFEIAADSTGPQTLTPVSPAYFYNFNPASSSYDFSSYDTIVYRDYALYTNRFFDSVAIKILPLNWAARPGFPMSYYIVVENAATNNISPSVAISYEGSKLTYDSSSITGISDNGSTLTMNTGTLLPGQQKNFAAYFTVKPTVALGTELLTRASASISTLSATDSNLFVIQGAFDPNDKQATPQLSPSQVANGKYIDYTIRFQNTGTDTAFNIVISDTLDGDLKPNTLQMIASSHNCKATVKDRVVFFEFLNILLPDSNINEPKSHGFVSFKVQPQPTVAVNTTIPNKAAIYFDFNAPIITNTAGTLIKDFTVIPLKLISFSAVPQNDNTTSLYWNTANEINTKYFTLERGNDGLHFNSITNIIAKGKANNNYNATVADASTGIVFYRLKITDNDGSFVYSPIIKIDRRKNAAGFSILSNPVKDFIIISTTDRTLNNTQASIINMQGAVVKTFIVKEGSQTVEVKELPTGIYYLKTINGSSTVMVRN